MPKLSKDSAPNVQDACPAIDRGGDLDDLTVVSGFPADKRSRITGLMMAVSNSGRGADD